MPHTTTHHRAVGNAQFAIAIAGADGRGDQVVICPRGACADEGSLSDHAHLQAGILRHHAVFHDGGHEQGGAKWQEGAISHH